MAQRSAKSDVFHGTTRSRSFSWVEAKQESRERLKKLLEDVHPNQMSVVGRDCSQLTHFVADISEGWKVPTKRIVNASPLILLTKIGRIDLLNAEDVEFRRYSLGGWISWPCLLP